MDVNVNVNDADKDCVSIDSCITRPTPSNNGKIVFGQQNINLPLVKIPACLAIAFAVSKLSPVTILTKIPAF
jgi:hypothetical protein